MSVLDKSEVQTWTKFCRDTESKERLVFCIENLQSRVDAFQKSLKHYRVELHLVADIPEEEQELVDCLLDEKISETRYWQMLIDETEYFVAREQEYIMLLIQEISRRAEVTQVLTASLQAQTLPEGDQRKAIDV